jgi:hypothetical protein
LRCRDGGTGQSEAEPDSHQSGGEQPSPHAFLQSSWRMSRRVCEYRQRSRGRLHGAGVARVLGAFGVDLASAASIVAREV